MDLFDEALEPSLSVAFDGTDSTPCLDARQICCCVDFLKISVYDRKYMVVFDINIAHVVFDISSISVKNISIHIVYILFVVHGICSKQMIMWLWRRHVFVLE